MKEKSNNIQISILNKKIKENESNLFKIERKIQEQKSSLGSIIANNKESAHPLLKSARVASGILFGLSLPYAFGGDVLFAVIAASSSLASYSIYSLGTKLDRHDRVWRKKCLTNIEKLKKSAKAVKVDLYHLYQKAEKYNHTAKDESNKKDKWFNRVYNSNNNNNVAPKQDEEIVEGEIIKDPILKEEIMNDFKKKAYQKLYTRKDKTNENDDDKSFNL